MQDYGFSTFDTQIHCEELGDFELHQLMERHPELFADPAELTADWGHEEELTLP
jgi:hypothetical protein